MNEKYLPIGTVVTLKEATKKIMIIGYFPMSEDKKVFDYNACTYPEGVIDMAKTLAFNHEQISSIDYMGFVNDESKSFNEELKRMLGELESLKNLKLPNDEIVQNVSVQSDFQNPNSTQPDDIAGIMDKNTNEQS